MRFSLLAMFIFCYGTPASVQAAPVTVRVTLSQPARGAAPGPTSSPRPVAATVEETQALKREFQTAGMTIPSALRDLGYKSFGDLDLKSFIAKIPKVQIIAAHGWAVADANDDGRVSARWERHAEKLTVTVDIDMWNRYPKQRANLALHEYLGALGYQDREYWLSSELWLLTSTDTQTKLSGEEKAIIERRIAQQTRLQFAGGGGVAGVGGGGEITTLYVRLKRVSEKLERFDRSAEGQGRIDALNEIFGDVESRTTVSYTSPRREAELERAARRKVPTACLISAGTCPLAPRPIGTGSNSCHCTGYPEEGLVIYPQ